jgi:hypothetical protein
MKIAHILWLLDPTPASGAAPSWKSFHSGSAWMAYVIHFPPLWGANYWIKAQLNAIFVWRTKVRVLQPLFCFAGASPQEIARYDKSNK